MVADCLQHALRHGDDACVIGVTSSLYEDDKTVVATSLAHALAASGERTLLVEADLSCPRLAHMLGIENVPGFAEVLARRTAPDGALRRSRSTGMLAVVTAGGDDLDGVPAAGGLQRAGAAVRRYARFCAYVVVVLPPALLIEHPVALNGMVDGLVVAVRRTSTCASVFGEAARYLARAHVPLAGFVVT